MRPDPAKLENASRGAEAERLVAEHLTGLGFVVLGRNVRVGRLELDLVARRDDLIVVVEVRGRGPGSWLRPLDSVDRAKRLRVRRAGELLWQRVYRHDPSLSRMRFDIVGVTFEPGSPPELEHVPAAF
jgi:putative endonuclease